MITKASSIIIPITKETMAIVLPAIEMKLEYSNIHETIIIIKQTTNKIIMRFGAFFFCFTIKNRMIAVIMM